MDVPLWASFLTGSTAFGDALTLRARLETTDTLGRKQTTFTTSRPVPYRPWHAQLKDRKLREAGSYGYLLEVPIPRAALERAASAGALQVRLEVDEALPGGLAVYGARFGRYPFDPTVVFVRRP